MPVLDSLTVEDRLRTVGLRPTRQRLALARLLFGKGDRHITAEIIHGEAIEAHIPVSLATVYNTLNQFTEAGLLREVATQGHKTHFDTNTSYHHHFYIESEDRLVDIPQSAITVHGLPEAPEGRRIGRIEIVVRLEDEDLG